MSERIFRIGQIVPSSNTTMETEIPAMFAARSGLAPERFTFHSSRMRMKRVSAEELAAMDAESDRCALELSDADVDVMGYACLVAIMAQGKGYHRASETRLAAKAAENGSKAPIVTSAGALIDGIKTLGAKRIALVAPYMKPLTQLVVE
jgi:maleate isomerase